jgi:hypothetical protein
VATIQSHYIKTASPDAIAAMKQFSEALLCSTCAPDEQRKGRTRGSVILLTASAPIECVAEGEGFEPPVRFPVQRFSSSTVGSEPLGKFSTLLDSSTAYKNSNSHRYDPFRPVLNMELLQFYYSGRATGELANLRR